MPKIRDGLGHRDLRQKSGDLWTAASPRVAGIMAALISRVARHLQNSFVNCEIRSREPFVLRLLRSAFSQGFCCLFRHQVFVNSITIQRVTRA